MMCFQMTIAAGFLAMADKNVGKEIEAIGTKHNVQKANKGVKLTDAKAMRAEADRMFAKTDKAAYFKDISLFIKSKAKKPKKKTTFTDEKLKDVKIEGDNATATADGKPMKFRKVNGAWYLTIVGPK